MRGPQTGLRRKAPVTGPNAPALGRKAPGWGAKRQSHGPKAPALKRKAPALGRKAPFTGRSASGTKALFVLLQCVVQIRGKNHSPSTHLSSLSSFGQGFTLSKPFPRTSHPLGSRPLLWSRHEKPQWRHS